MGKSITMCGVEECDRKSVSRGYCDKHYRRLRKYGDPRMKVLGSDVYSGPEVPPEKQCAVENCPKPKERREWCRRHHRLWQLNGDPLVDASWNDSKRCSIEGCADTVRVSGYCYAHYARFRRHGDPLAGGSAKNVAVDHEDGDRTCSECGVKKPIADFHAAKHGKRGRRLMCGPCAGEEWFTRYQGNKEHYDEAARAYRHERRAQKYGFDYDLGITRPKLRKAHGDHCVYCGILMDFEESGRKQSPTRATIEHIIPLARGGTHTWANVALACRVCNCTKSSKTPEEFAEYMARVSVADRMNA